MSWRAFLSYRRLLVTFAVAGTMGAVEWVALGHPVGLVFGLLMGALALAVAPLPWIWILPWGLRGPVPVVLFRATGVLLLSAAIVVAAYGLFHVGRTHLIPVPAPLVQGVIPHLSSPSAMVISIPLFAAAGWGLSRHLELERRLEVSDALELTLRADLEEARMRALQSRLDPHFLFNALNLVAELCRDEPEEAERCVVRLSALLRAVLENAEQPLIPLGKELDLCADYLDLCRVRYGERLQVELERDPHAEGVRVPFLTVQALCENAIRHGVERRAEGGLVQITSAANGDRVTVQVRNPGAFGGPRLGGLGIELTRRRLLLAFHDAAELQVASSDDRRQTVATLSVPSTPQTRPTT